jgi:hypothetical protein
VESDGDVLLDAVVEGCGLPIVEEEDHGYSLSKVVELQAGSTDGGQDAGVGDGSRRDGEFAGAEDEVSVRSRSNVMSAVIISQKTEGNYPNGSPTTRNATSTLSASLRISSLEDSTISRSAMMTSRP